MASVGVWNKILYATRDESSFFPLVITAFARRFFPRVLTGTLAGKICYFRLLLHNVLFYSSFTYVFLRSSQIFDIDFDHEMKTRVGFWSKGTNMEYNLWWIQCILSPFIVFAFCEIRVFLCTYKNVFAYRFMIIMNLFTKYFCMYSWIIRHPAYCPSRGRPNRWVWRWWWCRGTNDKKKANRLQKEKEIQEAWDQLDRIENVQKEHLQNFLNEVSYFPEQDLADSFEYENGK